MGDACSTQINTRKAYKFLVGQPEGKIRFGGLWRRREYNIKMGLRNIGYGSLNWINLAFEFHKI
jgi:hypothetical protein